MNKNNLFSMRYLGIYFILFSLVCGIATFVENAHNTEIAKLAVYDALWFKGILALSAISLLYNIYVFKLYSLRKLAIGLYHFAFVVMIIGAGITHYIGDEGRLHLREGDVYTTYLKKTSNGICEANLPFSISLEKFEVSYYPGSQNPSGYKSLVKINEPNKAPFSAEISMNRVLKVGGYRFFQSSYDQDLRGSILSVNHDPWGMAITYTGYALMALGMFLSLFAKGSRFRLLLSQLSANKTVLCLLFFASAMAIKAAPVVDKDLASDFGELWVSDGKGRIQPLNTYNLNLLKKISHERNYKGLSADEVVLSILLYPEQWKNEPIILVEKEMGESLGVDGEFASYNHFFDANGQFKLMSELSRVTAKNPAQLNKSDKVIINLTERLNVFRMIMEGDFLNIYPKVSHGSSWNNPFKAPATLTINNKFVSVLTNQDLEQLKNIIPQIKNYQIEVGVEHIPSQSRLKTEILYNKLNMFTRLAPFYATLAFLLLIFNVISILKNKKISFISVLKYILVSGFVLQTFAIAMRWYISGRAPMGNGYESMLIVSWGSILGGILLARKSSITLAISTMMGAAALLVAHINSMNPEITTLVPVLNSYWLSSHVASITASYGLFGICALLGLFNLVIYLFPKSLKWQRVSVELTTISKIMMIVAVYLISIGCFIGAIWANESWGRYWSWDPKETWCLISIIVYAFILHIHHVPQLKSDLVYNVASVWAISTILMTYFGVNYFLGGMHSYAGGSAPEFPAWAYVVGIILLLLSVFAAIRQRKNSLK